MSPHPEPASKPPGPGSLGPGLAPRDFASEENLPWTGITLVIAVLGLLLFMAVPMRNPSPQELLAVQREHRAFVALESLANSIEDFHNDHGEWPGMQPSIARTLAPPVHEAAWLKRQLEMCSNRSGETVPVPQPDYAFGPYLPNGIPTNPLNGRSSIRILREGESFESVVDGLYGWIYDPRSGEVQPHILPFLKSQRSNRELRHVGSGQRE